MEFDDLPAELLLAIFSYLPQRSLLRVAKVSSRWKRVALDPALWTKLRIDSSLGTKPLLEILEHATKLQKLDIAGSFVKVGAIASALPRFQLLKELVIEKDVLASRIMRTALGCCRSLTTLAIRGKSTLGESDVAVLSNLPWLTSLVVSAEMEVSRDAFRRVCSDCPRLQSLKLRGHRFYRSIYLYLYSLRQLRSLSLAHIYPGDVDLISASCPNLECLEVLKLEGVCLESTQGFENFLMLKRLKVAIFDENERTPSPFLAPPLLEWLDVPELQMEEWELQLVVQTCKESLRHIAFDASRVANSATKVLSACRSLESVHLHGLSGNIFTLPTLCKLSKLVRASLTVQTCATGTIYQLLAIVDVTDTSSKGGTRLLLDMLCLSQTSNDAITRELHMFKDFLASKTRLSKAHIRDLEEQYLRVNDSLRRYVSTSFPVTIKTLKHLELKLRAE